MKNLSCTYFTIKKVALLRKSQSELSPSLAELRNLGPYQGKKEGDLNQSGPVIKSLSKKTVSINTSIKLYMIYKYLYKYLIFI